MLAASHAVAGAIIASQVSDPTIAYSLAFLSHPLLDLFPHWDLSTRNGVKKSKFFIIWTSLLDAGIGFSIGLLLFAHSVDIFTLLLCMFIAQLPDWLEAPFHVFEWNFPPFSTIKKLQHFWHTKLCWPWGLIPQLGLIILAVILSV
jgi:hypothetical protein